MKVKVIWEQIYDSNEFYEGRSQEDLAKLDFETFTEGIFEELEDCPYDIFSEMKTILIEE